MEIESDGMHRKNVRPCPRTSVLLSFLCNMLLSSNSKNGMNAIQQQRRRVSVFARLSPSPLPVTCSCSSLSFLPVFQRRRNWPLSTLRLDLSHLRPPLLPPASQTPTLFLRRAASPQSLSDPSPPLSSSVLWLAPTSRKTIRGDSQEKNVLRVLGAERDRLTIHLFNPLCDQVCDAAANVPLTGNGVWRMDGYSTAFPHSVAAVRGACPLANDLEGVFSAIHWALGLRVSNRRAKMEFHCLPGIAHRLRCVHSLAGRGRRERWNVRNARRKRGRD